MEKNKLRFEKYLVVNSIRQTRANITTASNETSRDISQCALPSPGSVLNELSPSSQFVVFLWRSVHFKMASEIISFLAFPFENETDKVNLSLHQQLTNSNSSSFNWDANLYQVSHSVIILLSVLYGTINWKLDNP